MEEKEEKKEQEEKEDRGVFSNWDQNAAASAPALLPNSSCPSNAIQCRIQLQLYICTIVQNTILQSDNEMKILRYNTSIQHCKATLPCNTAIQFCNTFWHAQPSPVPLHCHELECHAQVPQTQPTLLSFRGDFQLTLLKAMYKERSK